jgi:hypothetical protein
VGREPSKVLEYWAMNPDVYFSSQKLVGNSFPLQEVENWFRYEKEASLELRRLDHEYSYHPLSWLDA